VNPQGSEAEVVWKCSRLARAAGWIATVVLGSAAVGLLVAAANAAFDGHATDVRAFGLGAAVVALAVLLVWRSAMRPKVVMNDIGILVVNPWTTTNAVWRDLVSAEAGYAGVTIELRMGTSVTAWAVQKSNMSTWLKRSTRADDLAEQIRAGIHRQGASFRMLS
jgi:hypothetical protein